MRKESIRFLISVIFIVTSCVKKENLKENNEDYYPEEVTSSFTPVKIYDFDRSKYEVFDCINSLVKRRSQFYDFKWMDSNWQYYLKYKDLSQRILFDLYFPGDDLSYLSNPDSTRLVLKSISLISDDDDIALITEDLSVDDIEFYNSLLDSLVILPTKQILANQTPYSIKRVYKKSNNDYPYYFLVRRNHNNYDTLEVVSYKGRYRLSNEISK
jgi:hypothetical protein